MHKFLGVEHYARAMPRIPLEELHASSVQHPKHDSYRWLLHSRRVPTQQMRAHGAQEPVRPHGAQEPVRECPGEQEEQRPSCAGVAVEDRTVWVCKQCRDALCVKKEIGMPGPALANLMWGGREHPAYKYLREAMRVLLGLGWHVYQQVILKRGAPGGHFLGLSGNIVMLTQPKNNQIITVAPPLRDNSTGGFVVLFTVWKQDVKKPKC